MSLALLPWLAALILGRTAILLPFSNQPSVPGALLTWTSGCIAALATLFLLPRRRFARTPEGLLLACGLPALTTLLFLNAVSFWWTPTTIQDGSLSVLIQSLSRTLQAFLYGPLLALAVFGRRRSESRRTAAALTLLAAILCTSLAILAFLGFLAPAVVLKIISILASASPLFVVFFLAAGLWILPHRLTESATFLAQTFWLSALPQALAHLPPTASVSVADLNARWQELLALSLLLAGSLDRRTTPRALPLGTELDTKEFDETSPMDALTLQEDYDRQRQTLKMLEKAVETMSQGVTITDMEGRILYVNPADARMHGYAVEELVGQEARLFASPAMTSARAVDNNRPWSREGLNATKDGRTFPVRLISDQFHDVDQEPLGTVTICEDLGEHETIREALARRDRILQAVGLAAEKFLSDMPWEECVEEVLERLGRATGVDLIYILRREEGKPFDPESVILAWGTPGGAVEASFKENLGLPDREALFSRWKHRLAAGETLYGRVADLPATTRQIFENWGILSFVVVPIFVRSTLRGYLSLEEGGERQWSPSELEALTAAARTFGASISKTEAAAALAESETQYRELLEGANDLIQSVSPDGRFLFVNRAWHDTLGYAPEELHQLRVWDVVRPHPPEGNIDDRDVVQGILADDNKGPIEALFVTKDGREITVEGSISCRYEDSLPVATRGIFRDITERKMVERMIQDFISTVSHELRTPLTSIIASLGLLESGKLANNPKRSAELVSIALRNSRRLLQLINNLLDLQKLSANKMTFNLEAIEVESLLEEALEDIRGFADSFSIRLQLGQNISPGLQIHGDPDRITQILNNLLSNAIKFSPDNEVVLIDARSEDEYVVITVADRGPGIPEEFRSRLFDRFTQFDSSSTRRSGGSGLGLSIVKGLVEGMDGSITLDTQVDQGTTFHVYLPRVADPILEN
jgi:PAS domain S-box-containing protein